MLDPNYIHDNKHWIIIARRKYYVAAVCFVALFGVNFLPQGWGPMCIPG